MKSDLTSQTTIISKHDSANLYHLQLYKTARIGLCETTTKYCKPPASRQLGLTVAASLLTLIKYIK